MNDWSSGIYFWILLNILVIGVLLRPRSVYIPCSGLHYKQQNKMWSKKPALLHKISCMIIKMYTCFALFTFSSNEGLQDLSFTEHFTESYQVQGAYPDLVWNSQSAACDSGQWNDHALLSWSLGMQVGVFHSLQRCSMCFYGIIIHDFYILKEKKMCH